MNKTQFVPALAAVVFLVAALPGQASALCSCYLPGAPTLPDGATADSSKMNYAANEIEAYQKKVANYKMCLEKCIADADVESGAVIDRWNATVEQFNNRLSSQ